MAEESLGVANFFFVRASYVRQLGARRARAKASSKHQVLSESLL
jgi:hypothetical protein